MVKNVDFGGIGFMIAISLIMLGIGTGLIMTNNIPYVIAGVGVCILWLLVFLTFIEIGMWAEDNMNRDDERDDNDEKDDDETD